MHMNSFQKYQDVEKKMTPISHNNYHYDKPDNTYKIQDKNETQNIEHSELEKKQNEKVNITNKLINRYNSTKKTLIKQYNENSNLNPRRTQENKIHNESRDRTSILQNMSKNSNMSAIGHYLDRRHFETQEKLKKMRIDKLEGQIYDFKPRISQNSQKIVKNLMNREDLSQQEIDSRNNELSGRLISKNRIEMNNQTIIRNNSHKNIKSNITYKLSKTIDELNNYKNNLNNREFITKKNVQNSFQSKDLRRSASQNKLNSSGNGPSSFSYRKIEKNTFEKMNPDKNVSELNKNSHPNLIKISKPEKDNNYDIFKIIEHRHNDNEYDYERMNKFSRIEATNNRSLNTHSWNLNSSKFEVQKFDNNNNENFNPVKIQQNVFKTREVIKIIENNNNISQRNNVVFLPQSSENNFNFKIDFDGIDQISQNNMNIKNNIHEIQQTKNNNKNDYYDDPYINKDNIGSSKRSSGQYNEDHTKRISSSNKRREDLGTLISFAENIKISNYRPVFNNNSFNVNNNVEKVKYSYTNEYTLNNETIISDQYKLDPSSKNYALEKLKHLREQMK